MFNFTPEGSKKMLARTVLLVVAWLVIGIAKAHFGLPYWLAVAFLSLAWLLYFYKAPQG